MALFWEHLFMDLPIEMPTCSENYQLTTFERNLISAIYRLDKNGILKILQLDDTIDSLTTYTDNNGDTLFHWAMKRESVVYNGVNMLEMLLKLGFDINAKNKLGQTIFHLACENRQTSVIDFCLRWGAGRNIADNHGNTAAHLAVAHEKQRMSEWIEKYHNYSYSVIKDSESFFNEMIWLGVDFFHARNQKGLSALYLANELGVYHIMIILLKRVSDLASVEKGLTPLLTSFLTNYRTRTPVECEEYYRKQSYMSTIVYYILDKSEFISETTLLSSLRVAIVDGHHKYVINALIERATMNVNPDKVDHGIKSLLEKLFNERPENHKGRTLAQIFAIDDLGQSFLHFACECGKEAQMIDFLMMNGSCGVNVTDSTGETPLHVAALSFNDDLVKNLIQYGAEVNVRDNDGKSPLHVAATLTIDTDIARLILEAGADVNAKDKLGKTPLHYAWKSTVIETLVTSGANMDILDVNGCSPLYDLLCNDLILALTVLEMLKYGADLHDPKIIELLQASPMKWLKSYELSCLRQHFVKLIAIDVHWKLPFAISDILDSNNQEFLKVCQNEVKSLKKYSIDDRISLCCFLRKNRNQRCIYLDNEKLASLVRDSAIERKFPNYFVLIMGYYNEAARRKPMLESATYHLNGVGKVFLPELCIDKILTFLSNGDLLRFIEAFDNVNLDGLNESIAKIHV